MFYRYPLCFKKKKLRQHFEHVQSKNEVVILGISLFWKIETDRPVELFGPTELEKRDAILLCCCHPDLSFILYFYNALNVSSPNMELI